MASWVPLYSSEIGETGTLPELAALFSFIDPAWHKAQIKLKIFSEGITNKLIGCFVDDSENDPAIKQRAAVVRVFGKGTEMFIDRERELCIQVLLSKASLAPPVFVKFPNGVCYGFVDGKTLTVSTVKDPKISNMVAERMAAYHCLSFTALLEDEKTALENFGMSSKHPCLWSKLDTFLNLAEQKCSSSLSSNTKFTSTFSSLGAIRQEANTLRAHIENLSESGHYQLAIGFCHNDLLLNNILFDSKKGQVHFIDFEYADFNYVAFDIANHFVEHCGVDDVDFGRYPDKGFQIQWLRCYLAKRHDLLGCKPPSEADVESWFVLVQKFALASYLLWSTWALVQNEISELEFDFFEFAVQRYSQFIKCKSEFLRLDVSAS